MNALMEEEEMEMPAEGDPELAELDKEVLAELMQFAKGGMAKGIAARHAPPPPAAGEMPPEDPEIPGVEAETEMDAEAIEGGEGGGLDVEKLKLMLAKLKG